jgi:hypothetical protein
MSRFTLGDWADRKAADLDPREVVAVTTIDGVEHIALRIGTVVTDPIEADLYDCLPPRGEPSTWVHTRKGAITGWEVGVTAGTDSEWMAVRLATDHDARRMYGGEMYRAVGAQDADDILTVRRSFMSAVQPA